MIAIYIRGTLQNPALSDKFLASLSDLKVTAQLVASSDTNDELRLRLDAPGGLMNRYTFAGMLKTKSLVYGFGTDVSEIILRPSQGYEQSHEVREAITHYLQEFSRTFSQADVHLHNPSSQGDHDKPRVAAHA